MFRGDTDAAAVAPHPDVLVRGDFVLEELSAEKGHDAFAKLVNVEHIERVLFEIEASTRSIYSHVCIRDQSPTGGSPLALAHFHWVQALVARLP